MEDNRTEYSKLCEYLREYEENKPYKQKHMDWICDRIEWAYHWRKISHLQMEELTDRACFILDGEIRRH